MRPAGPLPARVYWVRRALLIVVLLLGMTMLWWAAGRVVGGGGSGGGSTASGSGGSGAGGDGGGSAAAVGRGQDSEQVGNLAGKHKHEKKKPKHRRPVAPSGDCAPTDVAMDIQVHDVVAGHTARVRFKLTSVGVPACTLAVTADTLALRITSGSDVVWTSDECPNSVLARELVVRAHQPTVYTFDWNGYRSTQTCANPGKVAQPGGYWAEAALIGADVHRAYFDVK
jgi:hypothetical protein